VQNALNGDTSVFNVGYDATYGFPYLINIDPSGRASNDQRLIQVSEFSVTPSS
jgi:hypothetical protein